jgi:hypothetical protein
MPVLMRLGFLGRLRCLAGTRRSRLDEGEKTQHGKRQQANAGYSVAGHVSASNFSDSE